MTQTETKIRLDKARNDLDGKMCTLVEGHDLSSTELLLLVTRLLMSVSYCSAKEQEAEQVIAKATATTDSLDSH